MADTFVHRVLVTGSNGAIGQPVCLSLLARGHQVRGFDRVAFADLPDSCVGDLADAAALRRAMEGMDTVIHLAASPVPWADFMTEILPNNIVATFNVFDLARELKLRRVIFASSLQVGNRLGTADRLGTTADPVSPSNHYGLSKVYGEAMGEMYARGHGLDVIAVRLGFLPRAPMFVERLLQGDGQNIYISPGDCGRFFAAAVEADLPEKFLVFHAIGKAERPRYDIEPARRILGYEPRDRWPEGMAFPKP